MAVSSVRRHLIVEVVSWVVCTILLVTTAMNYTEIKSQFARVLATLPMDEPAGSTKENAASRPRTTDGVELRANRSGHFEVNVDINGRPLDAIVDTGATNVVLRYEDAERAGIFLHPSDFTWTSQTANGTAKAAPVMLSRVQIGNIVVRNVQATVAERGRLGVNLLGMSFLKRLQSFEVKSGSLILKD
jgi:aspartyl protease family protein